MIEQEEFDNIENIRDNTQDDPAPAKNNIATTNIIATKVEDKELETTNTEKKTHQAKMKLSDLLLEKGLISKDQLQIALKEQQNNTEKLIGSILVDLGFITESALGEVLTESSGTQSFDLNIAVLDANLINKVSKDIAIRYKIVPVNITHDSVMVAINDIYNIMALDQVRKIFPRNLKIVPVYASESQILEIIDQYYSYDMSIDGILKEIETGIIDNKKLDGQDEAYINPTVRLVNALLVDAIKKGASDIHFEPEGSFLRLRYRIDGKMMQIRSLHKDYWSAMAVRIKILSNMNIAESRNPQDGRIQYNVLGRDIDFRVATQPTIHGENIVMRILDKKQSLMPIESLGFSEHNTQLIKKILKRPEGIIIVTGPTGSGKTTTLYSILKYINSIEKNIMTLEDPVEYQLPLIRQTNIKEGAGVDFTDGIKALMRQDPDIIFVGEVRDHETANMALRAAMTGHQVFTTLHTNDALGAIPRLIDIGVQSRMLAGSLICVIAQRLTRKLCEHCKQPYKASAEECRILGYDQANPPQLYKHIGCEKCNFIGYKGRIAIIEVLVVTRELDELIAVNSTRKTLLECAQQQGYLTMVDDGIQKTLEGVTTLEEVINTIDLTNRL